MKRWRQTRVKMKIWRERRRGQITLRKNLLVVLEVDMAL